MFCKLCGKPIMGSRCIYCGTANSEKTPKTGAGLISPSSDSVGESSINAPTYEQPIEPTNYANTNVKQSNGLAIAGFVLSLMGSLFILGLILSIVGLVKSRQLNGSGKGFAIAGIVIASLMTIAIIVVYAVILPSMNSIIIRIF